MVRYWNPVPQTNTNISIDEAKETYGELVRQATTRQLLSDVPIGLLLSGGIDSSMILAETRRASDEPLKTFTVGFGADFEHDEAAHAAQTAKLFGTDHHEVNIGLDGFSRIFNKTLWHLEELSLIHI